MRLSNALILDCLVMLRANRRRAQRTFLHQLGEVAFPEMASLGCREICLRMDVKALLWRRHHQSAARNCRVARIAYRVQGHRTHI
jgi:hypothetical protein